MKRGTKGSAYRMYPGLETMYGKSRVASVRRGQAAFWLDWAPMILLGLLAVASGLWRIGASVTAGQPSPSAIVQTQTPPPGEGMARLETAAPSRPARQF